jgi:2,3-bisphosphoglycerate-dependent phosphoglycerate mutase
MAPGMSRRWPERLWIVRHGESAGNVARDAALRSGHAVIDIAERDADVALSRVGEEQARSLGRWFAELADGGRPTMCFASPYRRAIQTADLVAREGGVETGLTVDERLREREFGVLDRLTKTGIEQRFPDQVELRARIGKFYYRPPGGESWTDVILRLRSFVDTLSLHHAEPGSRVLVVAHQVVVLCLRYLIEELDEKRILGIDRKGDIANCGVTEYALEGDRLVLERYNFTAPLRAEGAPVTAESDAPRGSR